jgi:multidrug resistance efflux pump
VLVKEGMSVKKGQVLVRLKDTTGNYDIRLSQSSNAVSSARNTFQSSTITLDKSIQDASIALERAKSDYVAAQANAENNLSKALRDAQKSDLNRDSSDANVTLAQLQASLEKSKLDYQNLRTSNAQTLLNYNTSFQTSLSDLKKLYNKLLFEGDRLYGITPKFQSENINIRRFLGSSTIRPTLEFAYYDLQK